MSLDLFRLSRESTSRVLQTAMQRGGDFAEIYCEHARYNSLVMEEGILKTAVSSIEKGVGVRVVKGEKTGYAYTEQLDDKNFLKIAATAAAIADDKGSEEAFAVDPKTLKNYYQVADPSIDVDLDQKITWINKANDFARKHSDLVSKVTISYADSRRALVIADSRGRLVEDVQPMLRFSISVICEKDGERQIGRAGDGGRVGFSFVTGEKVKHWAEKAVNEALTLLNAKQAPAGMLPVILAPGDSGILLHEAIGHPLEADFNRKGTSAYTGRLGEMVADAQCTIIDDGTIENDRGAINIDDELNDSQRTVLIEEGRLKSYMMDEISARYFEQESTGNGRRESYKYQPLPRMRTTYMLPGKYSADEIVGSTQHGIYCKTFKGGQVDISNGNFTFVPSEAYLIEDGKITHPIKNFLLVGNGPDALSKVTMVGNDFEMGTGIWTCGKGQSVPVGVGLPTIKISQMTVGGQQA
ncbi:TldD/PmbA family protein [Acanthopleuribacter pedis]|uniref:Metalloprotease TldD n=1 Tax=Acanthopleuribacter pedis TaxID=442870 RepID=A0A8J7U4Y4_9BACT|nr:metallopeptidase TldD-related protein [Acanthopleuribacter pedis]MBO1321137.1 metalloprotease TldD [Acanthopleuribacter pedis]